MLGHIHRFIVLFQDRHERLYFCLFTIKVKSERFTGFVLHTCKVGSNKSNGKKLNCNCCGKIKT